MLSVEQWVGKIAVVTGASSGIGAMIAEKLVKQGIPVVGIARRKELVDDLSSRMSNAPAKLHSLRADMTNEEDIVKAFSWIKNNLGPVSILVNNAGVAATSRLLDGNSENWTTVFNTNVLGLSIATREAIKDMQCNGINGHIIHMNAINGHFVPKGIDLGFSCAAKFAVTALTETLRQELVSIGSKIKITSISPGLVKTDIVQTLVSSGELQNAPILNPSDIADAVLYVLSTPSHVQIHEIMIRPVGETC